MDKGNQPMTVAEAEAEERAKKSAYQSANAILRSISQAPLPDHGPVYRGVSPSSLRPPFPAESQNVANIFGTQADNEILSSDMACGKAKMHADDIAVEHHAKKRNSRMSSGEDLHLQASPESVFAPENEISDRLLQKWLDARYIVASKNAWRIFRDSSVYDTAVRQFLIARYIGPSEASWTTSTPTPTSFVAQTTTGFSTTIPLECPQQPNSMFATRLNIPTSSAYVLLMQATIFQNNGKKHYPKFFISGTSTNITDGYPIYLPSTFSNINESTCTKAKKKKLNVFPNICNHQ